MQFCRTTRKAARILLAAGMTLGSCAVPGQSSFPARALFPDDSSRDLQLELTQGAAPLHFQLQIKNICNRDIVLNLGYSVGGDRWQYPSAIQLRLTDPEGNELDLELKGPPIIASPIDPMAVRLSAGSSYSLPINLDDYVALKNKLLTLILVPGEYKIRAVFTGTPSQFEDGRNRSSTRYWVGTAGSNVLKFTQTKVVSFSEGTGIRPVLTLPTDKVETLPSPTGRWALVAGPITSRTIRLEDRSSNTQRLIKEYTRSVEVGWSPGSQAFFLNNAHSSNLEDAYLYWVHGDQPLKLNDVILNRDEEASEIATTADHAYFRVVGWYSADATVIEYCGHSGQVPAKQFDFFYRITSIGHNGTMPKVLRIAHAIRDANLAESDCSN